MKIVVIGGTGLIGSKLVAKLTERGHEAIAASPNTGVNTLTGEGLAEVMVHASVVVDVSNSPSFADEAVMDFFKTSTSNLLAAEKAAGVGHHVALSVVGTERLSESGYFRAKIAQEKLIKESGTPFRLSTRRSSSSSSRASLRLPQMEARCSWRRCSSSRWRRTTSRRRSAASPWARLSMAPSRSLVRSNSVSMS